MDGFYGHGMDSTGKSRPLDSVQEQTLKAEVEALHSVFRQASGELWDTVIGRVSSADSVHVTGF